MHPIMKNIFQMYFEMSKKIGTKFSDVHQDILYLYTKFHEKRYFLWLVQRRQIKCLVKTHFGAPKIVYTRYFLLRIFWHFKMRFLDSRCIYTYEPKHIYQIRYSLWSCLSVGVNIHTRYKLIASLATLFRIIRSS